MLVEHALRMTLVADSLSLQFRLPAPDMVEPIARSSAAIAGECDLIVRTRELFCIITADMVEPIARSSAAISC